MTQLQLIRKQTFLVWSQHVFVVCYVFFICHRNIRTLDKSGLLFPLRIFKKKLLSSCSVFPFDGGSFSCSLQPARDTTRQRPPHLSLQTTTVFPRYLTNRTRRPQFDHTEHKCQICASVFHFIGSQKGVGFAKSFCSQTTDVSDVKAAVFFFSFCR